MKMNEDLNVIAARTADYDRAGDVSAARARLVERWRHDHPEAAQEVSSVHKPLALFCQRDPGNVRSDDPGEPDEIWMNDTYTVHVRRRRDRVFGTDEGMVVLGISALDGSARHDWREFQAIKNQLAGPECEGFELYPADSRLMDPSNYFTLWCFPGIKRIKVGTTERRVWDAGEALAPQRAFPKGEL